MGDKMACMVLETMRDEDGNYIPCFVKEGETGYYPTDWAWGKDIKIAKKLAKDYNDKLGLSDSEVYELVLQSMRELA